MTTTLQTECLPVAHIVDDDEPFRQSLTFLLESSGWSTVEYDSAAAFLAADPPYPGAGCLILDIRMPRMDGGDAARAIRAGGKLAARALGLVQIAFDQHDRRARVARDTHATDRKRCELLLGRLGDGFFFLAL